MTYLEGEFVQPRAWSEEGVWRAGRLLRELHDDDVAERQGLPGAAARAGQLRLFLDGYGLATAERPALVDQDDRVRDP